MWIMLVMTTYFSAGGTSATEVRVAPSITAVEFSSRERCIAAAQFTKKQPKIYHTFCVQK